MSLKICALLASALLATSAHSGHVGLGIPFKLVDAAKNDVGKVLGPSVASIKVADIGYLVTLGPAVDGSGNYLTAFVDYLPSILWFLSSDCSGQAYAPFAFSQLGDHAAAVVLSAGKVFLYPFQGTLQVGGITANSYIDVSGACVANSVLAYYAPVGTPFDVTTLYKRPFHYK